MMIICEKLGYEETNLYVNFHIDVLWDKLCEIIIVGFDSLEV